MNQEKRDRVKEELRTLINRNSLENESNTPDHILAEHMLNALDSLTKTTQARAKWWNEELNPFDRLHKFEGQPRDILED